MNFQKGQIVEIDIITLAFGGAGMGKFEGMSVFVEKTMPGDKVKASFTKIKKQFAHADLVEIIKPSPSRITPKCSHSGTCGGCQLQFLPYLQQLKFKKQQVIDTFERIGKIYSPPVEDILGCTEEFYYRNKLEFSFGYDDKMRFSLGFHLPHRRYDILGISECYLQSSFIPQLLEKVKAFVLKRKWKPFRYSDGSGFLKSLFVREGKNTGEIMINLSTSDSVPKDFEEGMKEFVDILSSILDKKITSIYWTKIISKRGQPKTAEETLLFGNPFLTEQLKVGEDILTFEIPPQSFFQTNTHQAEVLYSEIVKIVKDKSPKVVFDLFCGTGSIGMFLSKYAKKVFGIEIDKNSVDIASRNAKKNGISNIEFFQGDVYKTLKDVDEKPSLIVVDPPRVGLGTKLVQQLLLFNSPVIVYVSCNPSTLARDCCEFQENGYSVKKIQPVDMFPHTFHIENVCLLEK